jgi:DNA-binding transcriptional ArsR family regulator
VTPTIFVAETKIVGVTCLTPNHFSIYLNAEMMRGVMTSQNEDRLVGFMHALGAGSRLSIVRLLLENEALCVGALSRRLAISPSAVSQHLRLLRGIHLVRSERRGSHIHYRLDRTVLESFLGDLTTVLADWGLVEG